jgi:hypothetical protein
VIRSDKKWSEVKGNAEIAGMVIASTDRAKVRLRLIQLIQRTRPVCTRYIRTRYFKQRKWSDKKWSEVNWSEVVKVEVEVEVIRSDKKWSDKKWQEVIRSDKKSKW